ncbi:MAG: NAD(P)/FAD-dependent oxidoreductase [Burkholderiaceae bacterium]
MIRLTELKLPLAEVPTEARRPADAPAETERDRRPPPHPEGTLRALAATVLGIAPEQIEQLQVFKRSFDARKADLLAVYIVDLTLAPGTDEAALLKRHAKNPHILPTPDMAWRPPVQAGADFPAPGQWRPVVVGLGPCGLFAALTLAQMGLKPLVLERGKPVRQRTKDTWGLWRKHELQPESNVQFGEGGAGLFSDGKLYSQIKDPRHLGRKVIQEFVAAGAPPEILYVAHPHVGTFKLVKVVEQLREQIIALGGEIRFQHKVTDLVVDGDGENRRVRGVVALDQATGQTHEIRCDQLVLALGHSSRDTFAMLHRRGVWMEAKPFSIGVRIEHPQGLIDRARWGTHAGHPLLGTADYKLVHHAANGRAVYSFCMCPGGTVVAATSEPGRVVTNGMSQYSRNERNANAGMVVGIDPRDDPTDAASVRATLGEDFVDGDGDGDGVGERGLTPPPGREFHPLAGVVLQRLLESSAFTAGGSNYEAPGQLVGDFLAQKPSTTFGSVVPSYQPGVHLTDLRQVMPAYATDAMAEALPVFGRKIKGYDLSDAVMTGVETRTSSPLRITRGDDYQSLNLRGLYPAGEGAGYAGGILSAGVDGIKVAEAVAMACAPST